VTVLSFAFWLGQQANMDDFTEIKEGLVLLF
jgi:hypothetical protein